MTTILPSRSDDAAWTADVVHALAASIDQKRPCMYCGTAFYEHPGVFTVIPDENDPATPAVFGSTVCAERWQDRVPWQPAFRTASGPRFVVGVGNYRRETR